MPWRRADLYAGDMPDASSRAPRVTVLVRTGCHLCGPVLETVERVCGERGEPWVVIDIDAPTQGLDGARLRERYGDYVPVVEVDGVQQAFWHLDESRLRRALG